MFQRPGEMGWRGRSARWFGFALAAAALGLAPAPAAGADPYRDVSRGVAEGLLALLPAVEGYVVSASGAEAYVDVAARNLVRPGMELQVYRPGADMVHPVTKQVLGSYEKDLGVLGLTEVRETYSRGTLDAAGAAAGIVPGDRVRISARRLRTLLHVSGAAPGIEIGPLAQALLARGDQSGRFAMIDEPAWAQPLAALGAPWDAVRTDPALLRRLGESAAADLLLLARIEGGAIPRVAVEVRSLRTGTNLGEVSERWPVAPAPAAAPAAPQPAVAGSAAPVPAASPAAVAPPSAAAAPAPADGDYITRELQEPAKSLAAGDIVGEGRVEVLLTDGGRLSLYRWEAEKLAWLWDEGGKGGRRVLSLDAGDIDGDGRTEVLVTVLARGRITSEIRRWQEGALRVVAQIDGVYLRTASPSVSPTRLLGQQAGFDEVLAGRVEQYRLAGATIALVGGTALPRDVRIFGMTQVPGSAPTMLYALDLGGHIAGMTPTGDAVWSSPRPYGGYPAPVAASELFGVRGGIDDEAFDEKVKVFQGRLVGEGTASRVRLVVPRNFTDSLLLLPRQREFSQGQVVILGGAADAPEEIARSRAFDGYVSDLSRADVDGDGRAEILFTVIRSGGLLRGDRGKLVLWRPSGVPETEK